MSRLITTPLVLAAILAACGLQPAAGLPEKAVGIPRRYRRAADFGSESIKFTATFSVSLPVPDLGTTLKLTSPFSYTIDLPSDSTTAAGKSDYSQQYYDNSWDNYYGNYFYGQNGQNYTNRVYKRAALASSEADTDNMIDQEVEEAVIDWLVEWRTRQELMSTLTSAMSQPLWWSEMLHVPVILKTSELSKTKRPDGHACLERAVCEVAAYPSHNHGLIGDFFNSVLNVRLPAERHGGDSMVAAKLLKEQQFDKVTEWKLAGYSRAQLTGQMDGDCSQYEVTCPFSLFKINELESDM